MTRATLYRPEGQGDRPDLEDSERDWSAGKAAENFLDDFKNEEFDILGSTFAEKVRIFYRDIDPERLQEIKDRANDYLDYFGHDAPLSKFAEGLLTLPTKKH